MYLNRTDDIPLLSLPERYGIKQQLIYDAMVLNHEAFVASFEDVLY